MGGITHLLVRKGTTLAAISRQEGSVRGSEGATQARRGAAQDLARDPRDGGASSRDLAAVAGDADSSATGEAPALSRGQQLLLELRRLTLVEQALPPPPPRAPTRHALREERRKPPRRKYPGITPLPGGGGYTIRATAVDPRTGKLVDRRTIARGCSYDEAVERFHALKAEIKSVETPTTPAPKLAAYIAGWLERRSMRLASALTRARYEEALRLHILPRFGNWFLDKIRRADVEKWMAEAAAEKYSAETINGWVRIFKVLLSDAVSDYRLEVDPTTKLAPLGKPVRPDDEPNSLTPDELPRFLDAAQRLYPQWYELIVMFFAIGPRFGELRPLRWDVDLNLETGVLVLQRSQRRAYVGPVKNKKKRRIQLPPELVSMLRSLRQRQITEGWINPMGLVFPSRGAKNGKGVGGYLSPSSLDKPLEHIATAARTTRVTTKAGRRSAQDMMRNGGVDPLIIRAVSGHGSDEMRGLYSTVALAETQSAVRKVIRIAGLEKSSAKHDSGP